MSMVVKERCPCGTSLSFHQCCQPFIAGAAIAPTPEALMRSRYSAFATGAVDYLLKTHHSSKRSFNDRLSLQQTCQTTRWIQLKVMDAGIIDQDRGFVEFMAVYEAEEFGQLHERSTFVKESDHWFYLDGIILPPVQPARGEPCWCGSGKKFKRCHG